jgi:hypothetical protein
MVISRVRNRLEMLRFRSSLKHISDLAPVDTDAGRSDVAIGFLTCQRHVAMMILAAKSFYHFSGLVCPLYVWDDGSLTTANRRIILRSFPHARIYGRSDLDYSKVKDFDLLRRFAELRLPHYESYALSLKLMGPLLSPGVPDRFILSDSDAFFFDWPRAVVEWIGDDGCESRYLQPVSGEDNVAEDELSNLYSRIGIRACPRINSGLLLLDAGAFNLPVIEQILSWYASRPYAWDMEQTIYRILMAASKSRCLDQDDYVLCLRKYSAVCHHFFTSVIDESHVVRAKILNLLDYIRECERVQKPPVVVARSRAAARKMTGEANDWG